MKISVIIPTYKPHAYLWECLDSLVGQTLPKEEYEIIIVLNGCRDPYYTDIWRYINVHPDINWRYIHDEKGGVSNARNLALSNALGEYITFIDDDDYVSESYLEELYNASTRDTISISNVFAFKDGDSNSYLEYVITDAYNMYFTRGRLPVSNVRKFFSCPWGKLIHRDIIADRRFDVRFKNGEDSLFMFLISDRIRYVDFTTPKAIYYRRYRENSAITVKKSTSYIIANSLKLIWAYTCIYIRHPFRYSFIRYAHAILGAFHFILVNIK